MTDDSRSLAQAAPWPHHHPFTIDWLNAQRQVMSEPERYFTAAFLADGTAGDRGIHQQAVGACATVFSKALPLIYRPCQPNASQACTGSNANGGSQIGHKIGFEQEMAFESSNT